MQEQVVVSPRLAGVATSFPQRYHLQAYYDSGVAGAIGAAAVAGCEAAVATAGDYLPDSADGTTDAIARAAYVADGPSAATTKIRFN